MLTSDLHTHSTTQHNTHTHKHTRTCTYTCSLLPACVPPSPPPPPQKKNWVVDRGTSVQISWTAGAGEEAPSPLTHLHLRQQPGTVCEGSQNKTQLGWPHAECRLSQNMELWPWRVEGGSLPCPARKLVSNIFRQSQGIVSDASQRFP